MVQIVRVPEKQVIKIKSKGLQGPAGPAGADADAAEQLFVVLVIDPTTDVDGGAFTDVDVVDHLGNVVMNLPRSSIPVGYPVLVPSGANVGIWLSTASGPYTLNPTQPRFAESVPVTGLSGNVMYTVGVNFAIDPDAPVDIFIFSYTDMTNVAYTDVENIFTEKQTVDMTAPTLVIPDDLAVVGLTDMLVGKLGGQKAATLSGLSVDVGGGLVVKNLGLIINQWDAVTGTYTGKQAMLSYAWVGTDGPDSVYRWSFRTADGTTLQDIVGATLSPVQAGTPTVDDDLTTKKYVDDLVDDAIAAIVVSNEYTLAVPTTLSTTTNITNTTVVSVPYTHEVVHLHSQVASPDGAFIQFANPGDKKYARFKLILEADVATATWDLGTGVSIYGDNPPVDPDWTTEYDVLVVGGASAATIYMIAQRTYLSGEVAGYTFVEPIYTNIENALYTATTFNINGANSTFYFLYLYSDGPYVFDVVNIGYKKKSTIYVRLVDVRNAPTAPIDITWTGLTGDDPPPLALGGDTRYRVEVFGGETAVETAEVRLNDSWQPIIPRQMNAFLDESDISAGNIFLDPSESLEWHMDCTTLTGFNVKIPNVGEGKHAQIILSVKNGAGGTLPVTFTDRTDGSSVGSSTTLADEYIVYTIDVFGNIAGQENKVYLPRLHTVQAHSHTAASITDLGTAATKDVAASGDASATEVVKGNDTRLTNSRTPTTHSHTMSDISDAGDSATKDVGTTAGTVAAGDDSRFSSLTIPHVHKYTGEWYSANGASTASTGGMIGVGSGGAFPVFLPAGTIDRIAVYSTVAAVSTWRLGMYAADSSGKPHGQAPFLDAGTVNMNAAAGLQSITISKVIPAAGIYWLYAQTDAYTAQPTIHTVSYSNAQIQLPGMPMDMSSIGRSRVGFSLISGAVPSGALGNFPSPGVSVYLSGSMPKVYVRYA